MRYETRVFSSTVSANSLLGLPLLKSIACVGGTAMKDQLEIIKKYHEITSSLLDLGKCAFLLVVYISSLLHLVD